MKGEQQLYIDRTLVERCEKSLKEIEEMKTGDRLDSLRNFMRCQVMLKWHAELLNEVFGQPSLNHTLDAEVLDQMDVLQRRITVEFVQLSYQIFKKVAVSPIDESVKQVDPKKAELDRLIS